MNKIRIAINTLKIRPGIGGGERSSIPIIDNLLKLSPANYYYLLYLDRGNQYLYTQFADKAQLRYCPFNLNQKSLRVLWEQIILPWQLLADHVQVLVTPVNIAPFWLPCASVVHVQSLQAIIMPEYVSTGKRVYQGLLLQRSVDKADAIMVPSNATKRDLIELTGVSESKIFIAPEAAEPPKGIDDFNAEREKFIFAASTLYPFKNYERLIKAFALFQKRYNVEYSLKIAGGDYLGQRKKLLSLVEELGMERKIIFLGRVKLGEIWKYYKKASLFVFISLYETFGLPILEAMACGCPVLASNVSSIPEVAGDAAVLVDPYDEEAIAEGMYQLLTDQKLRKWLVRRGLERVKLFSWRKTASVYLEAIQAAVKKRK